MEADEAAPPVPRRPRRSGCWPASAAIASTSSPSRSIAACAWSGPIPGWSSSPATSSTNCRPWAASSASSPRADLDGLHRRNQRLLTGQPGPIRYRLRRKSGELRWLQDTARAERTREADVVARVVGTLAERQRGDCPRRWRCRRSARMAALLAETLQACLLVLDVHGRLVWASDRPAEPLGAGCATMPVRC